MGEGEGEGEGGLPVEDSYPVVVVSPAGPGAPCSWPMAATCEALDDHPHADLIREAAVTYLWNWTGKVFGTCVVTVRPCRLGCNPNSTYRGLAGPDSVMPTIGGLWEPALVGGVWRNLTCGQCRTDCSCDATESVRLPGPVADIVEVTVGGQVLDPEAYRVDNRQMLVRDDGGRWPACQDMSVPEDAPGAWTVTYTWGVPVPSHGQLAAGVLACEMAKARLGDQDCLLPQRLQTVVREGITVDVMDPFEGLEDGKTGIWFIDSWVGSMRQPPQRSSVYLPGRSHGTRTTTFRGGSGL